MASLQVRELPELLYRKLQNAAERKHRSLAQQAVATIEKGLGVIEDQKIRRQKVLKRISEKFPVLSSKRLKKSIDLIREDRER